MEVEVDSEALRVDSDEESLRSPKGRNPSNTSTPSAGATTTRKRLSTLGAPSRNVGEESASGSTEAIRMRHVSSSSSLGSVSSPVLQNKSFAESSPLISMARQPAPIMIGDAEAPTLPLRHFPKQSNSSRKRRLIGFGTIIFSIASLLWFSVYQRHSFLGLSDAEEESTKRGPWIILALVLSFLGIAAVCAGISIQQGEQELRVRVVRGDSVLGMLAEQDEKESYTEPTTPQRVWALKALAEMDRL